MCAVIDTDGGLLERPYLVEEAFLTPGETVHLAVDFSHPYPGDQVYLFHCHNLEHEDQDTMIDIKVQA